MIKQKKKNQMIETVEPKNEIISANSDTIFPDAKDTLEISKQNWKLLTLDEILKNIQLESSKGNRMAPFFDSYISDENLQKLRDKNYHVDVYVNLPCVGPYVEIRW